ncbi:MAG: substrate-binding domain-containing protein [Chloroflexi bacterium]|nr:substrate-binding domain-containing protein [Chloroflexota bacterium]
MSLASTIGPIDAGIVPALLDAYRQRTGLTVSLTGAGTNKTLQLARAGGFDVVLVHALALEQQFIAEGYGLSRHEVMANDFVVVGPAADPARIAEAADAISVFRQLAEQGAPFLTRGDLSGTHVKELDVWEAAGLTPSGDWYRTAEHGAEGNVATARESAALQCYTLLDRATVLTLGERLGLAVLFEGDPLLLNIISVLPVDPARLPATRGEAAAAFVRWLLGDEAQRLIAQFGVADYGQPLFFPRAPGWAQTPTALLDQTAGAS